MVTNGTKLALKLLVAIPTWYVVRVHFGLDWGLVAFLFTMGLVGPRMKW